jgi:hypothetical protein
MYKTIWIINAGRSKTELTCYHFGNKPKFPSRYMVEGVSYEIEMVWNLKLVSTLKMFFKCLFHNYSLKIMLDNQSL